MSKESYTVTTIESKIKQLNQKKITKVKRNSRKQRVPAFCTVQYYIFITFHRLPNICIQQIKQRM